jgi:hypothetical protein
MRRFMLSLSVLMVLTSLMGCAAKVGCRDCGGVFSGVMNRPRMGMARSGGCETGACQTGACRSGGLFAPATGFANQGGCSACGTGNGLCGHHRAAEPPAGPPTGTYAYPYYTLRGPRDFLSANPPSIGP